jgi:high affinity Mn2+ porin
LQFGYNYLLPSRLLVGIEGDISFPNFLDDGIAASRASAASAVTEKLDFVSTLRGRVAIHSTIGFSTPPGGCLVASTSPGELWFDRQRGQGFANARGLGSGRRHRTCHRARLDRETGISVRPLGEASGTFASGTGYESATVDLNTVRLGLNRKLDGTAADINPDSVGDAHAIDPGSWNDHGQLTFIEQGYPAFRSLYQGANSLAGSGQIQNTTSATAFVGYRPWDGTEIYIDPELISNRLGVAGFPNGEAQKSNFPMPRLDIARVFVRQTFGLGGEQEAVEDGPNQLAGKRDISRITVTSGRFFSDRYL